MSLSGAPSVTSPRAGAWTDIRNSIRGVPRDYTTGNIGRAVMLLAIPMVLEMSMQSLFAVVDVFFVARLGPEAVAILGLSDSLLALVFSVAIGLCMGTTAMVARRIGEGSPEQASVTAVQAIATGIAVSIVLGTVGVVWASDLLQMLGASPELAANGRSFTSIMLGGSVTVMLLFLINAIFRGAGDAALAMRSLWLANLINMVLDPGLIFGLGPFPEMGLEGAAIATTFGRAMGVLYQVRQLTNGRGVIRIDWRRVAMDLAVMARLLRVSGIGVVQYLISTASFLGLIRILAPFGETALAGYTIAIRIIIFILLPAWGMGNAAATLVGQNLGAGNPERAEQFGVPGVDRAVPLRARRTNRRVIHDRTDRSRHRHCVSPDDLLQLRLLGLRAGHGPSVQWLGQHHDANLDQFLRLLGGPTAAGLDAVRPGRVRANRTVRSHRLLPKPARGGRGAGIPPRHMEATADLAVFLWALVERQDALPEADALGRHLDQFVVVDELDRLLEIE
mgnify:CR=1 FL=1